MSNMSKRKHCSDRSQKTAICESGFSWPGLFIYLPPLSLYYWVAIMFSCSVETFCRCASNWSGLVVKEPVLRLVLVHLGLESHEGRKPEQDYEAQSSHLYCQPLGLKAWTKLNNCIFYIVGSEHSMAIWVLSHTTITIQFFPGKILTNNVTSTIFLAKNWTTMWH